MACHLTITVLSQILSWILSQCCHVVVTEHIAHPCTAHCTLHNALPRNEQPSLVTGWHLAPEMVPQALAGSRVSVGGDMDVSLVVQYSW